MTPQQKRHADEFRETCRGFEAHKVAKILGRQTPGYDWRGCGKKALAADYGRAKSGPGATFEVLKRVDLERLGRELRE